MQIKSVCEKFLVTLSYWHFIALQIQLNFFYLQTVTLRPRIKRVCIKDLIFLLEQEGDMRHSPMLYKALLK